jgi:hypothetical protein
LLRDRLGADYIHWLVVLFRPPRLMALGDQSIVRNGAVSASALNVLMASS